jgi:hypothetical protein
MKISELFLKPIDRPIEGVIKGTYDDATLAKAFLEQDDLLAGGVLVPSEAVGGSGTVSRHVAQQRAGPIAE